MNGLLNFMLKAREYLNFLLYNVNKYRIGYHKDCSI